MQILNNPKGSKAKKNKEIAPEKAKIDIEELRCMCVTKYGLVNEGIRRLVWPILLNAESIIDEEWKGLQIEHLEDDTTW